MPALRLLITLAAFAAANIAFAATPAPDYVARFQNGQVQKNKAVADLFVENKEPNINGQRFFDPGNPIRTLRNIAVEAAPVTAGIELANGDILPGEIVTHVPATAESPAHFLIRLPDGPESLDKTEQIAVREGEIRRFWSVRRESEDFQPGLAVARDGRKWTARAVRFSGGSVQLLTSEGISNVLWTDLARLDFPQIDTIHALQREVIWSKDPGCIVRVKLTNGAEVTFPRPMSMNLDQKTLFAKPTWALIPLRILINEVVSYAFRDRQEFPLSLLPLVEIKQVGALHEHNWRRNVNPDGRLLRLGEWTHDLGLALHAPQQITFDLPKGAESFKAKIGVPHLAKQGCVKCRLHRDSAGAPKLWESDFLRGGDQPIDVQVNLDNAPRLTLVIDMAHDGRPSGADPLDIRDDVIWLDPVVRVRADAEPDQQKMFAYFLPALAGWELSAELSSKFVLQHAWQKDKRMFEAVLTPKEKQGPAIALEFRRQVNVSLANARVTVEAAKGGEGGKHGAQIRVLANRELLDTALGADTKTFDTSLAKPNKREYSLGPLLGKKVELTVVVEPQTKEASEMFGLWVRRLDLSPIILNVPSNGKLLEPKVPLESLKPIAIKSPDPNKPPALTAGKTVAGDKELTVRDVPFATGVAVPINTELTYNLDEKYTRFVAVLGLVSGSQSGPYSILLDGQPFWADRPEGYDRNAAGYQLDLAIPAGHKTITLKAAGRDGEAAWAQAGFITP